MLQPRGGPGATPRPIQPRTSPLHLQVRKLVSDFAIILAILASCAVDATLGLETPKLLVPHELKVLVGWAQQCRGTGLCPRRGHPAMLLLSFPPPGPALQGCGLCPSKQEGLEP